MRADVSASPVGPAVFGQQSLELLEKNGDLPGRVGKGDGTTNIKLGEVLSEHQFPHLLSQVFGVLV